MAIAGWLAGVSGVAAGQVTPIREYHGVGRPIAVMIAIPDVLPPNSRQPDSPQPDSPRPGPEASADTPEPRGPEAPGGDGEEPTPERSPPPEPTAGMDARLDVRVGSTGEVIASVPVRPGPTDLGSLVPMLRERRGAAGAGVLLVQLVVGDRGVGPPMVLAPMIEPPTAMLYNRQARAPWHLDPGTGRPAFPFRDGELVFVPREQPTFSGWRAWVHQHVVFETTLGAIEFRLRPDAAPLTVASFMGWVRGGLYTDVLFHRVVPQLPSGAPFVVQVGDPTGTGLGGAGHGIALEASALPHDFGVLSIARGTDPNSGSSQVFICLSREGTRFLDGAFASFAEAVSGAEVILSLAAVPLRGGGGVGSDRPVEPPVLIQARLIDAPPAGEEPPPVTRPDAVPER